MALVVIVLMFGLLGTFYLQKRLENRTTRSLSLEGAPLLPSQTFSSPKKISTSPCENFYKMVCQNLDETRDPTGSVIRDAEGEKQALRLTKQLIQAHPDWESNQIDEEVVKVIFNFKNRVRIESAYRWVQHSIERFVDRQPAKIFSPLEKRQIKSRLRRTKLQLPPPASVYADEPDLLTKNEVYYERTIDGQLRLRVGGAFMFIAKSWFNIIFTMGHELAHSIDPCEMRAARLSFPAYDHLTACFLTHGLIATRKTRSECGENDQLSETFADWVAAQVTAEALTLFSTEFHGQQIVNAVRNSVRDLCEQNEDDEEGEFDQEFHPSPQVRIEKIFGRNPAIRNVLGCRTTPLVPTYCTLGDVKL